MFQLDHKNKKSNQNQVVKPKGAYLADNRPNHVTQLQSVVQFGKDDWKTEGTKKAIKKEQDTASDKDIVDTAHHILPKSKLVDAHKGLSDIDKKKIGKAVTGKEEILSDKQLKSMSFNLTLGPRPEERSDDPGDGFDPNKSSGSLTPRSKALSGAWDTTTSSVDPSKLVKAVEEASLAHQTNKKMDRSKWKKVNGKYERDDA